jgi:hypothetical protein
MPMRIRFRLTTRGEHGKQFYCVDTETGKRFSLPTQDRDAARQIVLAKNQSLRQPKAQKSPIKMVEMAVLKQAIDLFQVDKGRFPKNLNELVTEKFIPKISEAPHGSMIDYDAKMGKVKFVNQP